MDKNPIIQINILPYYTSRFNFTKKSLDFLCKIKNENKKKIKLVIICDKNVPQWETVSRDINNNGIKSSVIVSSGYLPKINEAIKTDCKYSCCMDEDVMMSEYVWDFMIENVEVLDNENTLLLSPTLSNGIPSVELFIESFFNTEDKIKIYEMFKNTHIPNIWGVDYSGLNFNSTVWDSGEFYRRVKKINHYYKGIHPVRVSYDSHLEIAKVICNNIDKFLSNHNYNLIEVDLPYICNTFYIIKTDEWVKIINDKTLFRDGFDEVPMNLYKEKNNKKMMFVNKGYAIHMAYNTINIFNKSNQNKIESFYMTNLLNHI